MTKQNTTQNGSKTKTRISIWVYLEDKEQLLALARQRHRQDWSELAREALQDGTAFAAIKAGPDRESGNYGNLAAKDLAELVYLLTGQGIMWLERQGISITSPFDKVLALIEALARSGSLAGAAALSQSGVAGNSGEGTQKKGPQPLILGDFDGPQETDSVIL